MQFFNPRKDPREEWHLWFAWRPVRLRPGDGSAQPVAWLEWIDRRCEYVAGYDGAYRFWYYRKS